MKTSKSKLIRSMQGFRRELNSRRFEGKSLKPLRLEVMRLWLDCQKEKQRMLPEIMDFFSDTIKAHLESKEKRISKQRAKRKGERAKQQRPIWTTKDRSQLVNFVERNLEEQGTNDPKNKPSIDYAIHVFIEELEKSSGRYVEFETARREYYSLNEEHKKMLKNLVFPPVGSYKPAPLPKVVDQKENDHE